MTDLIAVLAVTIPCLGGAIAFFVLARRKEGLDRKKFTVGGVMLLVCALLASFVAWTLVLVGPPGH